MMKRFALLLMALLLAITPAMAYQNDSVTDEAMLLTDGEETALEEKLEELAERYDFQLVFHTVNGIGGQPIHLYAADFYDENGYGFGENADGMVFVIDMDEREYVTVTTGHGIVYFSDYAIAAMEENILDDLSAGNYYDAFSGYLMQVEKQLEYVKNQPVVYYEEPAVEFGYVQAYDYYSQEVTQGTKLTIAAVFSGIVTAIVMSVMVARMKTARKKIEASDYVQGARFTRETDTYLYSTTRKRKIQTSSSSGGGGSSTFKGSSGRTHGGGRSGKF